MTNLFRFAMYSFVVFSIAISGCTTKFNTATDAHNIGDFEKAASNADSLAPMVKRNGKDKLNVQYERDELWIGLEKAKIFGDAGKFKESIDLFTYVDAEAEDLREIESWYIQNPLDTKAWDVGQFTNDIGQSVMGADQLPFLLQPYEMILGDAYASLNSLLLDQNGAAAYARKVMRLQHVEKEDLRLAGYDEWKCNRF